MKQRRISKSVVLTSLLLCGLVLAGAYAVATAEDANAGETPAPAVTANPVPSSERAEQSVVYDGVELRRYEGENGHSYIHDVQTNHTEREITGYQCGMLAFDQDGNPLKIDWWCLDTALEYEYFNLYENISVSIAAGGTDDVFGGWSLNVMGEDTEAPKIAYVLYCNKEITFADGTVWENPDFESWRLTYEGKKTDVTALESYYPYEHKIDFSSLDANTDADT